MMYNSYTAAAPVTPHDSNDQWGSGNASALLIGTAGNLSYISTSGATVTLIGVPVGLFPVPVARVRATLTTAANITALFG